MDTLILGIGNLLLGDEGVGVHVARHNPGRQSAAPRLECLDGGTGSLVLLEPMQAARRLILVDATADARPPAPSVAWCPDSLPISLSLAAHDIGLRISWTASTSPGKGRQKLSFSPYPSPSPRT